MQLINNLTAAELGIDPDELAIPPSTVEELDDIDDSSWDEDDDSDWDEDEDEVVSDISVDGRPIIPDDTTDA